MKTMRKKPIIHKVKKQQLKEQILKNNLKIDNHWNYPNNYW